MTSEGHDNPFAALWDGVFDKASADLALFGENRRSFIERAAIEIELQALRSAQEELSALVARDLRQKALRSAQEERALLAPNPRHNVPQNSQTVRGLADTDRWYQKRVIKEKRKLSLTLDDFQIFDGKWVWQAKEAYLRAVLRSLRFLWGWVLQQGRANGLARRLSQQDPHQHLSSASVQRLTRLLLDVEIADRPTGVGVRRRCMQMHSTAFS